MRTQTLFSAYRKVMFLREAIALHYSGAVPHGKVLLRRNRVRCTRLARKLEPHIIEALREYDEWKGRAGEK